MANGVGGALIIGVAEKGKGGTSAVASELCGIPNDEIGRLEDSIKGLVDTHLSVRPAALRFHRVPLPDTEDRSVLIISVPQNTYSLSMVTYQDLNQFWVRRSTDNRLMTTDEIHYEIEKMMKLTESAEEHLERVCTHIEKTAGDRPTVWFAAVPLRRSRDHLPIELEAVRYVLTHSSYREKEKAKKEKLTGLTTPAEYAPYLRPTLYGIGAVVRDEFDSQLEISRDGTIIFARSIGAGESSIPLSYAYELWYSALCLLRDLQGRFALSRLVIVQSGLCNCAGIGIVTEDPRETHRLQVPTNPSPMRMDSQMLDENWLLEDTFQLWVRQFCNALGLWQPLPKRPWVT